MRVETSSTLRLCASLAAIAVAVTACTEESEGAISAPISDPSGTLTLTTFSPDGRVMQAGVRGTVRLVAGGTCVVLDNGTDRSPMAWPSGSKPVVRSGRTVAVEMPDGTQVVFGALLNAGGGYVDESFYDLYDLPPVPRSCDAVSEYVLLSTVGE